MVLRCILGMALTVVLAACGRGGGEIEAPEHASATSIAVTSRSLKANTMMPIDYTCDGKGVAPHLTWSAPPPGTRSLVVLVEDLDAPGGLFTHYVVFNIPAERLSLAQGEEPSAFRAQVGLNDRKSTTYDGPCPPAGELHRYRFRVLAVNAMLRLEDGASRDQVESALRGHVIGSGSLEALFGH